MTKQEAAPQKAADQPVSLMLYKFSEHSWGGEWRPSRAGFLGTGWLVLRARSPGFPLDLACCSKHVTSDLCVAPDATSVLFEWA